MVEAELSKSSLKLNPELDIASLAREYAKAKRGQIRNLLTPDSAQSVLEELKALSWGIVFNDGPQVHQMHAHILDQLGNEDAARLMMGIRERARTQYQFIYGFYPILNAYFSSEAPWHGIFDFYELLNSEPVLEAIRTVTGLPNIRWADAQATWFKPGHFLKAHTDEQQQEGRLAAYVFNMSPVWERDWGGFLQFFDENDNIEAAFMPSFNTLNLFTIPMMHSVSMVSTYVTERRMAVTGWFRCDEPPGPIGNRR
jgi:Rps23 Pro-64 3,4-dihydroxylase Tpa1-like proline 4-hydroxylase